MSDHRIVALDGPSAAGKSTVARGVAQELEWLYVDSGALYRAITWQLLSRNNGDAEPVINPGQIEQIEWSFFEQEGAIAFQINGYQPVEELRNKAVREAVASVAAQPVVRKNVVSTLRSFAAMGSLVIEGRDIGSVVFPDTPHKFYLDADPHERAMRRYRELEQAGENEKAEAVLASLAKRDKIDSTRAQDPLQVAPDAYRIDTTHLALKEVIEMVINRVMEC
jgi:cytidylate kinase